MAGEDLMRSHHTRRSIVLGVLAALVFAGTVTCQEVDRLPRWKIDPYTRNDPERMRKAGYISFGPFPFGELGGKSITSDKIEEHLSYAQIIWVETKHFRIGSSLEPWHIPNDLETVRTIRAELERLREKLGPKVNPRTRILDKWLRLHLTAQRMEDLYTDMSDWLGVKDEQFPKDSNSKVYGATYMGEGPYLGMKEKYLVLVMERGSTYFDYLKAYTGRQSKFGQRWHYMQVGCLFYGIAFDMLKDKHDINLHNDLLFNVSINMIDGFRHYSYDLPVWIREGLGHWWERKNNPKWNRFDQDEAAPFDPPSKWRWEPYVRELLLTKKWSKFSEVIQWRHYGDINFVDHVMIWARVDFLMRNFGKEKFHDFMFVIKGRFDEKKGTADQEDLVGVVRDALKTVYGLNPLNFDEKFEEWAVANYAIK